MILQSLFSCIKGFTTGSFAIEDLLDKELVDKEEVETDWLAYIPSSGILP
jgi:hypothetical protein